MGINTDIVNQLLNESESESLDFKREQYPFINASDTAKSELLKDILAFANSWRRVDAYILVGVEEVKGGRCRPIGISQHLDDNDIQQFVNSKTQRPVTFSYTPLVFEGIQLGCIYIPQQDRPIFLKQDYGKLKKNTVYIRRSSSTAEADPEEIARIGAATIHRQDEALLELQFADVDRYTPLGKTLSINSEIIDLPEMEAIPKHVSRNPLNFENPEFNREVAKYVAVQALAKPIGFALYNAGQTLVSNVQLKIIFPWENELTIFDKTDFPKRPVVSSIFSISANLSALGTHQCTVQKYNDHWVITVDFGNIRPGETLISYEPLYIGANKPQEISLSVCLYADNLSQPLKIPLSINISTVVTPWDLNAILARYRKWSYDSLPSDVKNRLKADFEDAP